MRQKRLDPSYRKICRDRQRKYLGDNPQVLTAQRDKHGEYRSILIESMGGKCRLCGESSPDVLHIDHIKGGGSRERKLGLFPSYLTLRKVESILVRFNLGELQLLCASCNARKAKKEQSNGKESRRALAARKWRMWIIECVGGRCVRCHASDPETLQFDHVNGDGFKDRLKRPESLLAAKKILTRFFLNELQLLCASCNWKKRSEDRELRNTNEHQGSQVSK